MQHLWLDVSVADTQRMDVTQGTAHLVHVQLHIQRRHALPVFRLVLADAIHRLRYELQHKIQVHLRASS